MPLVMASLPLLLAVAVSMDPSPPDAPEPHREADENAPAAATTEFALDLYRAIRPRDGDAFCSPLSIAAALAMTSAGARGETAEQIHRTLHIDRLGPDAPAVLGRWLETVRNAIQPGAGGEGSAAGLWTANAVWLDAREKPLPDFVRLVGRSFQAEARAVDFVHAHDEARQTINRWVEDQTRDKIKDLLRPPLITPDTVFVLTSAIYFKGYWTHPFSPDATRDDDFHPTGGTSVRVKMMNQTARLRYFEDDAVQVLELPYKDGSLAMVALLPRRAEDLPAIEAALSVARLDAWLAGLKPNRVKVSLPRFKSTAEVELKDVLSTLGMPLAFRAGADFSGITGSPGLVVSAVVHKAFVEVEEKGTEAAAATAVVGVRTSAMIPAKEVVFRADHPFIHLIRDTKTGAILFMGRLSRP